MGWYNGDDLPFIRVRQCALQNGMTISDCFIFVGLRQALIAMYIFGGVMINAVYGANIMVR